MLGPQESGTVFRVLAGRFFKFSACFPGEAINLLEFRGNTGQSVNHGLLFRLKNPLLAQELFLFPRPSQLLFEMLDLSLVLGSFFPDCRCFFTCPRGEVPEPFCFRPQDFFRPASGRKVMAQCVGEASCRFGQSLQVGGELFQLGLQEFAQNALLRVAPPRPWPAGRLPARSPFAASPLPARR